MKYHRFLHQEIEKYEGKKGHKSLFPDSPFAWEFSINVWILGTYKFFISYVSNCRFGPPHIGQRSGADSPNIT